MKNKNSSQNNSSEELLHHIPDIEIIDLEADNNIDPLEASPTQDSMPESDEQSFQYMPTPSKGKKAALGGFNSRIIHLALLAVIVLFVLGIVYKIANWGVRVKPEDIVPGEYNNTLDSILPLVDTSGKTIRRDYSGDITILAFGNAPFADDRNSNDSLINMIREKTNATIYNCSVSGSYLAAEEPSLNEWECPSDAFNFYWLCLMAAGNKDIAQKYLNCLGFLGDSAPPEAMEVYDTLTTLDMNTVDVVVLMYDGSDYLAGHEMYSDSNRTDIQQFTGNMEAGIEVLQQTYPHIRIIVMSPPYAFGLDENGKYVSSDIQRYGWSVLSTYVIKQADSAYYRLVSFVDNLYGTVNEDEAPQYLTDHIHLNVEGRKRVAERFVNALYLYNDEP